MLVAEFDLTVLYTQIVVCGTRFHDFQWTNEHVAQGFAYVPGDVSFGVPDHDGTCRLQIYKSSIFDPDLDCLWAVQVPFEVTDHALMVGTVIDPKQISIERGKYNLVFAAFSGAGVSINTAFLLQLHFINNLNSSFSIIKKGTELKTDKVLREDADVHN